MDSKKLTALENSVIHTLLKGDDQILSQLREQFRASKLTHRDLTGSGFFCYFSVPQEKHLKDAGKFYFGDIGGKIQGLENDVGFVLFIKDGLMHTLEGYTYGNEPWPKDDSKFELFYFSGKERDLKKLRENINKQINKS